MFYDQEAQCHECNRRLVLVRYVQVCPECGSASVKSSHGALPPSVTSAAARNLSAVTPRPLGDLGHFGTIPVVPDDGLSAQDAFDALSPEGQRALRGESGIDWTNDPCILLDGLKCVECGGILVAEPVEFYEPTIVRCRDCGGLA